MLLDLKAGSKGLKIEVEVGTLPTTAETIEFTGKLIDGQMNTVSYRREINRSKIPS